MASEPYYIAGAEDSPSMHFDVEDESGLQNMGVGKKVQVHITGTIKSVRATEMRPDYDAPYKQGKKRPMKKCPGSVCVELDKKPEISALQSLNNSLRGDGSEDY